MNVTTFKPFGILASNLNCLLINYKSQASLKIGDLEIDFQPSKHFVSTVEYEPFELENW